LAGCRQTVQEEHSGHGLRGRSGDHRPCRVVIPFFWRYTYSDQDLTARNLFPNAAHIFGTDNLGRDLFIRVIYGARISLSIGIVASIINLTIGVLYGGLSGYLGGRADNIMMRIVDLLYSVPLLLYVILLQVVLEAPIKKAFENSSGLLYSLRTIGPELFMIFLVLGMVYWVGMARMVRGQVLQLKNQEFVLAAKSQGAGLFRIILRHLVPNVIGQIIVMVMMSIPQAIFTEAFLSFIGLGVSAPLASWGSLASDAYTALQSYPYLLLFPAGAICITVLAFNILGDGLRDALDPHMKK
jgi:oligopeptide transport system permease protein